MLTKGNIKNLHKYCRGDITKVKGYKEASEDVSDTKYVCHHIKEIENNYTMSDLKRLGIYYNCDPKDLEIMTRSDHQKLHQIGRQYTEAQKQKMSKVQTGKILREETKQKISEARKGSRVQCIETGKVYECGHDAEKELGIGHIGRACKEGGRAGGFHWKFVK